MLLRHSALYALGRGVPGLINFVALSVYTRLLLPDQYGQYSSVIAWVSLVNALLFQWLKIGVVRFVPAFQDRREAFLSTVFATFLVIIPLSAVFWALIYLAWPEQVPMELLPATVILLWALAWFELNLELVRAQLQPVRYGMMTTLKALVALVSGAALALAGLGALGVVVGLALGFGVPALMINWSMWRQVRFRYFDAGVVRQLLRYGLPLIGTLAMGFVTASSDRLLIKHFLGDGALGQYAVGYDLAQQTMTLVFMMIGLASMPLMVKAYEQEGQEAARAEYRRAGRLFFLVTTPAAVGLYVIAEPFMKLAAGSEFHAFAPQVFTWTVLGSFLQGLKSYYVDSAFFVTKNTAMQLWTAIPAAVINTLWNVIFIPRYGLLAAVHSTLISYAVALVLSLILAGRLTGMRVPLKDFLSTVLVSLVMGWAVRLVGAVTSGNLLVMVGTGAAVYVLLALLLNVGQARTVLSKAAGRESR